MIRISTASWFSALAFLVGPSSTHSAQLEAEQFALLSGTEIVLVNAQEAELARLTSDKRAKFSLRWVPGSRRLSYEVKDDAGANRRLVIIDLKGDILNEIAILPRTDPPSYTYFRYVKEVTWLTENMVRVYASINNWNCGILDISVETGKELAAHLGQCGTFVDSADGKHVAYVSLTSGGPDEQRQETVQIDSEDLSYRGSNQVFRVISRPVWSEDSGNVAFVLKTGDTGMVSLAFLDVDGKSDRVPLPSHFGEEASLIWLGADVAVRNETEMLVVNKQEKRTVRATAAMVAQVEKIKSAERQKQQSLRFLDVLRKKFAATECVARPQ